MHPFGGPAYLAWTFRGRLHLRSPQLSVHPDDAWGVGAIGNTHVDRRKHCAASLEAAARTLPTQVLGVRWTRERSRPFRGRHLVLRKPVACTDRYPARSLPTPEDPHMQIQVNTDSSIEGDDQLIQEVQETVAGSLDRFGSRITRVEVHLSDVNAQKGGRDTRCVMEARAAGLDPVTVDERADNVQSAVRGAAGKMERALDTRLGKLRRR